jgi:hypothetical protein
MLATRFSRPGTTLFLLALVWALAAAPPAARAQSYLPLQVGNQWVYSFPPDGSETKTVTGTVQVFGREASVIRYGPSPDNEGLENYWSISPDGDVLLHGFNRTLDPGLNFLYDPPIGGRHGRQAILPPVRGDLLPHAAHPSRSGRAQGYVYVTQWGGRPAAAREHLRAALALARNPSERRFFEQRLGALP